MQHRNAEDRTLMVSRREAVAATLGMLGMSALGARAPAMRQSATQPMTQAQHEALMRPGKERIAIVLYPHFTALDAIGPHHVFINLVGAKVNLVAKTMEPVPTDTGFAITPTATFDQLSEPQTLIMIPGGTNGTLDAMGDDELMAFVRKRGADAEWVGSVCTGSLLLAGAGLLDGYRATSHWLAREALRAGGATPVEARFVEDRNRVTGAGVSAGLDFALHLARKWRGDTYTKGVQMFMEYDPQPPFRSGSPTSPDAEQPMVDMLRAMHAPFGPKCEAAIRSARAKHEGKGTE